MSKTTLKDQLKSISKGYDDDDILDEDKSDLLAKLQLLTKKANSEIPDKKWGREVTPTQKLKVKAELTPEYAKRFEQISRPPGLSSKQFGQTRKLQFLLDHYEINNTLMRRQVALLQGAIREYVEVVTKQSFSTLDLEEHYEKVFGQVRKVSFIYQSLCYDSSAIKKFFSTQESTHLYHCIELEKALHSSSGQAAKQSIEDLLLQLNRRISSRTEKGS